jgi:thiamine-phosphate pyrophosphorylase
MLPSPLQLAYLYGILDLSYVDPSQASTKAEELCAGGVDALQLRAKNLDASLIKPIAQQIQKITYRYCVPFILNDHAELAAEMQPEGLHIGQDDLSVAAARAIVGPRMLIGKSTHSVEQALAAVAEGADYIGFGPLYATGTKPDYRPIGLHDIRTVHERVQIPIFCIGGVNPPRLPEVLAAGAERVVMVSALLQTEETRLITQHAKHTLRLHRHPLKKPLGH